MFAGSATDFIAWLVPQHRHMIRSTHLIGNILLRISGSVAESESYFSAFVTISDPSRGTHDQLVAGRYLDRFQKRRGSWKILSRQAIYDWYRLFADTQFNGKGQFGPNARVGAGSKADYSYSFLSSDWHHVTG
jgi:hypothetical protein